MKKIFILLIIFSGIFIFQSFSSKVQKEKKFKVVTFDTFKEEYIKDETSYDKSIYKYFKIQSEDVKENINFIIEVLLVIRSKDDYKIYFKNSRNSSNEKMLTRVIKNSMPFVDNGIRKIIVDLKFNIGIGRNNEINLKKSNYSVYTPIVFRELKKLNYKRSE